MKRKAGAAFYLNTRPLVYGFLNDQELIHQVDLQLDIPANSELLLRDSKLDFALIPSIEYALHANQYCLIPSGCIASDNQVGSVLLFFNQNLENIHTIAIDISSRTSVALLKLLLKEKFQINPRLIAMKPDINRMLKECDAALLIGDNALNARFTHPYYLDLAEEWVDLTDLPFVFAVWAGKIGKVKKEDEVLIQQSKLIGINHLDQIAIDYFHSHPNSHSKEFLKDYVTDYIQFDLSEERMNGMVEFFQMGFMHGILESLPEIKKISDIESIQ